MLEKDPLRLQRMSNIEANQITREALRATLMALMEEKDFQSITISELVAAAGVSRQAFYRNYKSKEAIVLEVEQSLLTTFRDSLHDPKYLNSLPLWFHDFFQFLAENEKTLSALFRSGQEDVLFEQLSSMMGNVVTEGTGTGAGDRHYRQLGVFGAFRYIAADWLQSGMPESPEDMARVCADFFQPFIGTDALPLGGSRRPEGTDEGIRHYPAFPRNGR